MGIRSKLVSFGGDQMTSKPIGALHDAVQRGDQKAVESLLLKRTSSLEERDENLQTALHVAVVHNHSDLLEWLLAARSNRFLRSALDIDAFDIRGNSALHTALIKGVLRPAFLLLKDDASPFLPNRDGKTPLLLLLESTSNLSIQQLDVTFGSFFHTHAVN